MKEHLLLKGGTAINLTIFNLPRLSVDIDLDFVPNLPREKTMSARKAVSDIIRRYMCQNRAIAFPMLQDSATAWMHFIIIT